MTIFRPLAAALLFLAGSGLHSLNAAQPGAPAAPPALPAHLVALLSPAPPVFGALQASTPRPKAEDPLPDGKGKDVTKQVCSGCHSVTMFASQHHTADEWSNIIDNMVSKGLSASDADLDTIQQYLSTYLGPPKPASGAPTKP